MSYRKVLDVLYNDSRKILHTPNCSKNNDGKLFNEKESILNRWVRHFDHVLNGEGEHMEQTNLRGEEISGIIEGDIE